MKVAELVHALKLEPHPEGGFYRESYRSATQVGDRSSATEIYFLLPEGKVSLFHRIKSDEIWHFYLGGPMTLIHLNPYREVVLGQNLAAGEWVQHLVPAGTWFGGFPNPGAEFSLVGCTVTPGFDFQDFEMAQRDSLLREFPQHAAMIKRLTPNS